MKKVAYIASECVPFIKTGGLADVVGTLPRIFDKKEYDVRVIIPNYMCLPAKFKEKMRYLTHFHMDIGWKQQYVGVMYLEYEGVPVYFIDNEYYFNGFNIYSDDMKWDIEKFCYFSKAALSILPSIGFQPDIVHCHDWQAGLVPVYLKTLFADNPFYSGMKSIMTIHNLQFQGRWDIKTVQEYSGLPDYLFTPDKLEYKRDANMLKGGLVYADYITTVSETYAQEIQTPEYGEGMDGLLSARHMDLRGIVNGIDYDIWNPETDAKIQDHYSIKDFKKGKAANKRALQEALGLTVDENKMIIGLISRLTDQKGLDLIAEVMEQIVTRDAALTYALLKMANSAYFSAKHRTASVRQAIMRVGINQLKQWVYLLSFREEESGTEELMKTSFMRANFAAALVKKMGHFPIDPADAYLMGMFSTLECMIDATMEEILNEIPIVEEVKKALISGEGEAGTLYHLILAYERADWTEIKKLSDELGLQTNVMAQIYMECVEEVSEIWENVVAKA